MVRHRPTEPLVCLPIGVLHDRQLHRTDLHVLAWLKVQDPFDSGTVAKSHVQIAEALGHRTEGAAGRSIRKLVAAGWLEVIYGGRWGHGNRGGDANVYRFGWLEPVDNEKPSR